MSWVRYDDQFWGNPKAVAAMLEHPGSIGLHVFARTWSACQKRPGYVPASQPSALVYDRVLGPTLAAILVKTDLWHLRGKECAECRQYTKAWPGDLVDGYVIHQWWLYGLPARDRSTSGTPSELSAKRAEAGRRGGLRTQSRRRGDEPLEANSVSKTASKSAAPSGSRSSKNRSKTERPENLLDFASTGPNDDTPSDLGVEANSVSKSGKLLVAGVSPITEVHTEPSNEGSAATSSQPRKITQRSKDITDAYAERVPLSKWPAVNGVVIRAIKAERYADDEIRAAVLRLADDGRPVTVDTLRVELEGLPPRRGSNGSQRSATSTDRVSQAIEAGLQVQAAIDARSQS